MYVLFQISEAEMTHWNKNWGTFSFAATPQWQCCTSSNLLKLIFLKWENWKVWSMCCLMINFYKIQFVFVLTYESLIEMYWKKWEEAGQKVLGFFWINRQRFRTLCKKNNTEKKNLKKKKNFWVAYHIMQLWM